VLRFNRRGNGNGGNGSGKGKERTEGKEKVEGMTEGMGGGRMEGVRNSDGGICATASRG